MYCFTLKYCAFSFVTWNTKTLLFNSIMYIYIFFINTFIQLGCIKLRYSLSNLVLQKNVFLFLTFYYSKNTVESFSTIFNVDNDMKC